MSAQEIAVRMDVKEEYVLEWLDDIEKLFIVAEQGGADMALKRPVFFREYAENGIMDEGANHAGTSNLN